MRTTLFQDFFTTVLTQVLDFFYRIHAALVESWAVTILLGIVLCFFGVRVFGASVIFFGALVGGSIGYGIGSMFFDVAGGIVGACILGIVCGFLLRTVVRIGFFLAGLFLGGFVGTGLLGNSLWVIPVIIASGVLSAVFYKYFVIVATALWGALLLSGSLMQIAPFSLSSYPYAVLAIKSVVCAGGAVYQIVSLKKPGVSAEGSGG